MGVKGDRAVWEAESYGFELLNSTIGDLLDQQAEAIPDREALVYNYPEMGIEMRLNYRQYRDEANKLAKGLIALGIEKGQHVAVWSPNLPQWVLLEMALAKIGAVLVTINTAYRAYELEYVLRQGDINTLFMVEEVRGNSYLDSLYSIVPELKNIGDPATEKLDSTKLPYLKRAVLIGNTERPGLLPYNRVLELGATIADIVLTSRQARVTPHDIAQIQYTSGTTGFPKGAMLTHYNILNNAHLVAARGQMQPEDRMVTPMPLFHTGGCVLAVLTMLDKGGTLIPLIAFDPIKQLDLISKEKATISSGVPAMLVALLNHPRFIAGEFDTSSLRSMTSGGASVPVVLMEQVKEKMGADAAIVFGQTEASPTITQTVATDSFELKSATVGLPTAFCEVKIVNPHTGEPVGLDETGELLARGYLVMRGYYNMPDKTAETIDHEGWLHTGDLATMNQQGYINIVGRVRDMVIRGGENMYPAEIEEFLMRHPKVAEAQIIGLPDSFMGEEMAALLRLKPGVEATEDEIRDYCRANISKNKMPKYIKFVTDYPMTVSGKIKKFELKEQLIKEFGLEAVAKVKTA